jgi:ABC-type Zn2+ transport system substrate-binding protein/surface adhesin
LDGNHVEEGLVQAGEVLLWVQAQAQGWVVEGEGWAEVQEVQQVQEVQSVADVEAEGQLGQHHGHDHDHDHGHDHGHHGQDWEAEEEGQEYE